MTYWYRARNNDGVWNLRIHASISKGDGKHGLVDAGEAEVRKRVISHLRMECYDESTLGLYSDYMDYHGLHGHIICEGDQVLVTDDFDFPSDLKKLFGEVMWIRQKFQVSFEDENGVQHLYPLDRFADAGAENVCFLYVIGNIHDYSKTCNKVEVGSSVQQMLS